MEPAILSSPPRPVVRDNCTPPPCGQQRVIMSSSSPDLPSPSTFFSRKVSSALRSGARAAQAPDGAITSFATASSLIESHQLSLSVEESPTKQKAKRQRGSLAQVDANTRAPPKKPTKRSTTKAPQLNDDPISKRPRKKDVGILDKGHGNIRTSDCPLATTKLSEAQPSIPASIEQVDIPAPKSAPSKQRKPRQPKAKSEAQTKLKKGRITKPGGRSIPSKNIDLSQDGAIEAKLTGAVAEHFLWKQSLGITRNNEYQILKTESPPTVEDFGKGVVADSINSTHTNVLREISKEAKSAITVEEAPTSERALERRTKWTPVKDTEPIETEDVGSTKQETESLSPLSVKNSFANRLADYAYSENTEPDSAAISMGYASGTALTKRRRIELIGLSTDQASIAAVSDHVQLEKAKAPKKKARTITDLVTAQYVRREAQLAVPATTSDFLATQVDDKYSDTVSTHASDLVSIKPARQKPTRHRSSRGGAKKERVPPKSKAKPKLAAAKLLSPGSAIRKMNKQDILFGTSSQLAQEESPSFIRGIQQAICESEAEVAGKNNDPVENLHHSTGLSLVKATRSLWTAAARDFGNNTLAAEGSLYKPPSPSKAKFNSVSQDRCRPEIFNSSQSRKDFTPTTDKPKPSIFDVERSGSLAAQPQAEIVPNPQAFTDIDEFGNPTPRTSVGLSDFLDIEDFRQHAASVAQDRNSVTAACIPTGKESVISPPPTDGSVIASLTKTAACSKLAKDIPKIAVRNALSKQPAMNTQHTLSKMPKARSRKSILTDLSSSLPTNQTHAKKCLEPSQISHSTSNTPKKSVTQLKFTHIDEISDSESEPTPTPPLVPVYCNSLPPLELCSSQSSSRDLPPATATSLAWATTRLTLFPKITNAVKNAPRSVDPSDPSWYEKILMYDPIVLEDLTAWLNRQGLRIPKKAPAVKGIRKEKGKKKVKEPQNNEVNKAQVVDKELEAWMVQKWCEEKSVCCLWREGLRGGVKSRY